MAYVNMEAPVRVLVTSAAGDIAYTLVHMIASGEALGKLQPIILLLNDKPQFARQLEGFRMELIDCIFPLLQDVIVTHCLDDEFANIRCVFFVQPENLQSLELTRDPSSWERNVNYFKNVSQILNRNVHKHVKIVIVGQSPNTHALICRQHMPSISPKNISALTRIDQNRAHAYIAAKANVPVDCVENVIAWGGHSMRVFPDAYFATVKCKIQKYIKRIPLPLYLGDYRFLKKKFISVVRHREFTLYKKRMRIPAISISKAACDHMREWWFGTTCDQHSSMAVLSDGSYGVPRDIYFSYPVTIDSHKNWHIVQDLNLYCFSKSKLERSMKELMIKKIDVAKLYDPKSCKNLEKWVNRCQAVCPRPFKMFC